MSAFETGLVALVALLAAGGVDPAAAAAQTAPTAAAPSTSPATPGPAPEGAGSPAPAVGPGGSSVEPVPSERRDERQEARDPSRRRGSTTALVVTGTRALAHAGRGRTVARVPAMTTWSGQPTRLLVLESVIREDRQWIKVRLPSRPNGSSGWIPADHTRLRRSNWWVAIHRRSRTVDVYFYGRRRKTFRVVVGASRTPTPRGLAAIYERNPQRDPRAFLGPWAIALTATSNVVQRFDGGPGRIGLHGRSGSSLRDPLGSARSHGCIRMSNTAVSWIAHRLPTGTPVEIR